MADEIGGNVSKAAPGERPRVPRDVLEGVRRRDPEALGRLFDATFDYVYRVAYRLLGNREAAEDATQDVFVKVHRAADGLQTDRDPMPWLTTIVYNACRDAMRRTSARPEVDDDDGAQTAASADDTPEEALLKRERERVVQNALLQLDETTRAVVTLHDYGGLSHEEVAVALEAGAAGVRKRYSRGLKRLAQIIGSREL